MNREHDRLICGFDFEDSCWRCRQAWLSRPDLLGEVTIGALRSVSEEITVKESIHSLLELAPVAEMKVVVDEEGPRIVPNLESYRQVCFFAANQFRREHWRGRRFGQRAPVAEIDSLAWLWFLVAARRFNHRAGIKFSGYAIKLIISGIHSELIKKPNASNRTPPGRLFSLNMPLKGSLASRKERELLDIIPDRSKDKNSQETVEFVSEAVSGLPDHLRQVIRLRFFEGLTLKETAKRTGTLVAMVCDRQKRALAAIRKRCVDVGIEVSGTSMLNRMSNAERDSAMQTFTDWIRAEPNAKHRVLAERAQKIGLYLSQDIYQKLRRRLFPDKAADRRRDRIFAKRAAIIAQIPKLAGLSTNDAVKRLAAIGLETTPSNYNRYKRALERSEVQG